MCHIQNLVILYVLLCNIKKIERFFIIPTNKTVYLNNFLKMLDMRAMLVFSAAKRINVLTITFRGLLRKVLFFCLF